MTTQDRLATGVRLARLRFPDLTNVIEDVLRRDENFRDMCEELADLEEAIASIDTRPGLSSDVLADWMALRDRQIQVIAEALSRANVVPWRGRS